MTPDWPFDNPPNVTTLTTRYVLEGEPICHAYRDWSDGMWQFFPDRVTETADGKLVCLKEIFKLDPSIAQIADLPPGWMATRPSPREPWQRAKNHPFPVFADDGYYLDDATAYEQLDPVKFAIPSEEARSHLKVDDTVKLIFRCAAEDAPRQNNECEGMWVKVIEVDAEQGRYMGSLDNDPSLHSAISCGDQLWFHPTHVFALHDPEE
ncbi:MAG: hypothetical protein ACO1TE_19610 [Prosthecobacter sp.]